jgi:dipeptidase E
LYGYAVDDGAAFHFLGEEFAQVVSSRSQAKGFRVEMDDDPLAKHEVSTLYLGKES